VTYSIVARDGAGGAIGAAAASHYLAVGSRVTFARPGVGAVAVQSYAPWQVGPQLLDRLAQGEDPARALSVVLADSPLTPRAQVGVVDADGRAAGHTGDRCVAGCGQQVFQDVAVQANMVVTSGVCSVMKRAFEATRGDLAQRLLAALEAAEATGGDLRGRQSAALLVHPLKADAEPIADLRVDDHPEPLVELRRLDAMRRAAQAMTESFLLARDGRVDEAIAVLSDVQAVYGPNLEPTVWASVLLARAGRVTDGAALVAPALTGHAGWSQFLRSLPAAGLLPDDPAVLARLIGDRE
jgi:uncharacterized Ntn-hydrolase superfamily protein